MEAYILMDCDYNAVSSPVSNDETKVINDPKMDVNSLKEKTVFVYKRISDGFCELERSVDEVQVLKVDTKISDESFDVVGIAESYVPAKLLTKSEVLNIIKGELLTAEDHFSDDEIRIIYLQILRSYGVTALQKIIRKGTDYTPYNLQPYIITVGGKIYNPPTNEKLKRPTITNRRCLTEKCIYAYITPEDIIPILEKLSNRKNVEVHRVDYNSCIGVSNSINDVPVIFISGDIRLDKSYTSEEYIKEYAIN